MHPFRFVIWRSGCIILALTTFALFAAEESTPPASTKSASDRAEIAQILADCDAARARNEIKTARDLAEKALTVSRRLPPGDPAFVRVALRVRGLWCEYYLAQRNTKGALASADEAIRIVQLYVRDEKQLEAEARRWSGYAVALATQSLPVGDPLRVHAEIREAEIQCWLALRVGDPARARAPAERGVDLARPHLKPGDPTRVARLLDLAYVRLLANDRPAALPVAEEAANEARLQPSGNEVSGVSAALIAATVHASTETPDAEALSRDLNAVAAFFPRNGDGRETLARVFLPRFVWEPLREIARTEAEKGDSQNDEARFRQRLDKIDAALRSAHLDNSETRLGRLALARFQWEGRRITAAENTLDALDVDARASTKAPGLVAPYWNLKGLIAAERFDLEQARTAFETSLALYRQAKSADEADPLNGLGLLLLRQGDFEAARGPLRAAVEINTRRGASISPLNRVTALLNLAAATAKAPEAETLRRQALTIAQSATPPSPYAVHLCRNALGHGFYQRGQIAEARLEFQRAREIAVAAFGPGHFHTAESEVNLGWMALAANRPAEARDLFRAALASFRATRGTDDPRTAEALTYLALALAGSGEEAESRRLLEEAIGLRERYLRRIFRSSLSERDRLALVQELRVHPESSTWPGALDTYLQLGPQLKIPVEDQYRHILTWKGVISRHAPPRAADLEADPKVTAIASQREAAVRRLRDAVLHDPRGEAVVKLEAEVDTLERSLRAVSPRFRSGGDTSSDATPEALAAALPKGSALLDIIKVRRHLSVQGGQGPSAGLVYIAMLLRPDRPLTRVDLGDAETLDASVNSFRNMIEANDDYDDPAAVLSQRLREPLAPHLADVKTLAIAADGLLHRLPFAAVPGARPGTFWIDELLFVTVVSSQSLLNRDSGHDSKRSGALLIGGVDYGPADAAPNANDRGAKSTRGMLSKSWSKLDGTLKEAEDVAAAFRKAFPEEKPVEVLSGSAPRKRLLQATLPKRRFVHLATHGIYDLADDLGDSFATVGASTAFGSCIVLAGANLGDPDSYLTAEEMGELDLRGVDLFVLSACQSGLGRVREGQGMIGLLSALDRAGAHRVLCSLWSVDDRATQVVMQSFYRHLWASGTSESAAEALRSAQRELIAGNPGETEKPYAHPYFWAPFFLTGDGNALPMR